MIYELTHVRFQFEQIFLTNNLDCNKSPAILLVHTVIRQSETRFRVSASNVNSIGIQLLCLHFGNIHGNCGSDWTACCRYSSCRWNYAALLYDLNGGGFKTNPEFIIFLSNCCAVRNAVVDVERFIFDTISYLKITSPKKSLGACHCNPMSPLGLGLTWVAVLSTPSQLINLTSPSMDGANRPIF